MKRIFKALALLCAMALLSGAVPALGAEGGPTLYFTNATVYTGGGSAYCYLRIKDAVNISAMDYIITYDADNLELTNIYKTGATNQSDVTVSVNSEEAGKIHVTLVSQNGINGSNYMNLMYFKAKENARVGTYTISVLVNDIFDSNLETVVAQKQSGTITIAEGTQTVKTVSFSQYVTKTTVEVGDSFDYKLSSGNLKSMAAGAFEFTYDDAKLKLNDVTLSSAMEKTVYDVNDSISSVAKLSFASENAITSGSNMVVLNFTAIGAGDAKISFKPGEMYDYEFSPMSGNELTRTVTIKEKEVQIDYPDFKVVVPDEIHSDKEFEVGVLLEGGSGVRAGDFVVNYNKEVLECTAVTQSSISGAWMSLDKSYTDGQVRFSLMANKELEEDTWLVTIKLKAVENTDSKSDMTVSGSMVYDGKFNPVTLEYIGAQIKTIRPEYEVCFYDSDGETLLLSQKVLSGNGAIAPKTDEIRTKDKENHLKFAGWDKDYLVISDNTRVTAVYADEAHTVIKNEAVSPECEKTGLTEGSYCPACEDVLVAQEVVPATGHTEVDDEAVAPTCEKTGLTEGVHCSVCDKVLVAQNVVDALGHTEVIDKAVEPDCEETGLTEGKHCSVCDKVLVAQNVVDALGHTEVIDKL